MDTFARDKATGALINTDNKEFLIMRDKRLEDKRNKELIQRVDYLEKEVLQLKDFILKLSQGT